MNTLSFDSMTAGGVQLTYLEAVALVQKLIASSSSPGESTTPVPPALKHIVVNEDGSVAWGESVALTSPAEAAALLDDLLSRGRVARTPGGLRYLIARALRVVDAPAFASLADFSVALERHEQGSRTDVLRELFARAAATTRPAVDGERRRSAPSPAELRRQLREADAALFAYSIREQLPATAFPENLPAAAIAADDLEASTSAPRGNAGRMLAGALGILLAFVAGYVVVDYRHLAAPPHSTLSARQTLLAQPIGVLVAPAPRVEVEQALEPPPEAPVLAPTVHAAPLKPTTADGAAASESKKTSGGQPAIVRAVSAAAGPVFSPSFASDGTALFFHAGASSGPRSALEAAPLTGDDLRVMTIVDDGSKNYHVQPSPDGERVAFDSDRDGERGVYIANRDGTKVRRVSGPGYAAVPTWSPDGTQLAFIRSEPRRPQVWNLWLLDIATGNSRRLTAFPYGETWSASWFPDGRRIAYTHEDRVIVRELESGADVEYASPVPGRLARTPAVSPNGRYVIFQVARSGAWLLDLRDGSMKCVLADPTAEEFAWAPDGRRVAFHSRRDGQWGIWLMTAS
jgi:Tol biopolymer transport system component